MPALTEKASSSPALEKSSNDVRVDAVPPGERIALAARIQSVVEREMDAVERVLETFDAPSNKTEAERSARTLASLARTLREITALIQPDQMTPPDDADDDSIPRDIDELRRELARRLKGLVDAERAREGERPGRPAADMA